MLLKPLKVIVGMVILMTIKTYSELITIPTFEDRYRYLRIGSEIGKDTFGFDRYLNQSFYKSDEWKSIRDYVIVRDHGCDLGIEGREIWGRIIIHHMNPITKKDILTRSRFLLDPEFLICTIKNTHDAIHYGDETLLVTVPLERQKNDTCPWRR